MKKKWLAALLVLAVISIGTGSYLKTDPAWMHQTYYDYYNQGILARSEEKAANDFAFIANNSKDPWLRSLALAQVGTITGKQAFDERLTAESRYQIARYSIEILKEAVVNNPDNEEAKYNLELLLSRLPDLEQEAEEEGNGEEPNQQPGYSHGGENRGY